MYTSWRDSSVINGWDADIGLTALPSLPPSRTSLERYNGAYNRSQEQLGKDGVSAERGGIPSDDSEPRPHDWRFYIIIGTLCVASLTANLEMAITILIFPAMIRDIGGQDQSVWIVNAYSIGSMVVQPLAGQAANIFGRRVPFLLCMALFAIGTAIGSAAQNSSTMLAARTIQGVGSGAIMMLLDLIVCDLCPLKERSKWMGVVLATSVIGTTLGPIIGGLIIENTTWRWAFWLNLPTTVLSFIFMAIFFNTNYDRDLHWKKRVARIDYTGNFILIGSVVSLMIALVWGGDPHPWNSWQTLVPLLLGLAGLVVFLFHQDSRFCKEPTVPLHLFRNRTSLTAYIMAFLSLMQLQWMVYMLPVYLQAVLKADSTQAGIDMLPISLATFPGAILAGLFIAKVGHYRPVHFAGWGMVSVGFGLLSILGPDSSTAVWVIVQIIPGLFVGTLITSTLPAIQASLSDADDAAATGTFAFLRSLGIAFGVTIPLVVLNSQANQLAWTIGDLDIQNQIGNNGAYAHVSGPFVQSLDPTTQAQVIDVYTKSLQVVWYTALGISLFAFLLGFLEKDIPLRTTNESKFGLSEKN